MLTLFSQKVGFKGILGRISQAADEICDVNCLAENAAEGVGA
jgi:hypothetical protein